MLNESEAYSSDGEKGDDAIPEPLREVFGMEQQKPKLNRSIFTKNRERNVDASNVEAEKMRKANELFDNKCIFNSVQINEKKIMPMNSAKLEQVERKKQRAEDAGKKWGSMPKVELTEALRADLKTIKFRN